MADDKNTGARGGGTRDQTADAARAGDSAEQPGASPSPEPTLNETVPGGRYLVNGQTVDAEGRPLESA